MWYYQNISYYMSKNKMQKCNFLTLFWSISDTVSQKKPTNTKQSGGAWNRDPVFGCFGMWCNSNIELRLLLSRVALIATRTVWHIRSNSVLLYYPMHTGSRVGSGVRPWCGRLIWAPGVASDLGTDLFSSANDRTRTRYPDKPAATSFTNRNIGASSDDKLDQLMPKHA